MQYRTLGRTGLNVSILGLGGYHLLEIGQAQAEAVFNRYLEAGGNYIETAAAYGDGASERKVGRIGAARRAEYLLATKVSHRTGPEVRASLDRSLKNLKTDYVDILFLHAVQSPEEVKKIMAPGGALEVALAARKAGQVRFIGLTGHGQPAGLLPALEQFDFDVLMTNINYYDHFNFPGIAQKLLPLAQTKGCAVMAMKAFGDGYLWRSAPAALRYTLSQPVSLVVAGFNSLALLETDLEILAGFQAMSPAEIEALYRDAVEFRGYVCRQCAVCPADEDLDLKRIFELEGWFDRQMWDGKVTNPEDYSLRIRLGSWFGQQSLARTTFAAEGHRLDPETDFERLSDKCPYGLDLGRKVNIAWSKLTGDFVLV